MAPNPPPKDWVAGFLKVSPTVCIMLIIVMLMPWQHEIKEYEQTVITSVLSFFAGSAATIYAYHYGNGGGPRGE